MCLIGVEVEASAGKKLTRIFFSWMDCLLVCSMCDHSNHCQPRPHVTRGGKHTRDATLVNSLSAVTRTDCTRNLSRHFASAGGSSFIACRRTTVMRQPSAGTPRKPYSSISILLTSTSCPGSMRPELGLTQYLHHDISAEWGYERCGLCTALARWF